MNNWLKSIILFLIGGLIYFLIEVIWRGYSDISMAIVGGISFLVIGLLNEKVLKWDMSLLYQSVIGMVIITSLECISGLILNVWLGLGIWDYSQMPLAFFYNQTCVPFMIVWWILSFVAIILDDYLRYILFHEEKPHYKFLK